ncbi:hypothetical protein NM688_g2798 [Phlebia brevispora]|uniref:Uncharacterized protein n=1 Tax=Phlebia brevispora TaxID=194682 RepID=A0ACC1T7K0_9APHY|nr:hypothetical protein NM688_g2798 [Phlebia brevispora]
MCTRNKFTDTAVHFMKVLLYDDGGVRSVDVKGKHLIDEMDDSREVSVPFVLEKVIKFASLMEGTFFDCVKKGIAGPFRGEDEEFVMKGIGIRTDIEIKVSVEFLESWVNAEEVRVKIDVPP